ncbi:sugar 3,4-ketoisomerase [Rufibacter sediminis]|uniref:FdtA/QdtA family cupin domain-containing protein n=1 Tax=Rufibacter sediminis TaxID=2762756 RepID=A0ABR6VVS8_9BACT|nr:FdtA/QdtA family cupin domain-containing protein [Rufibacter sediminis]MBC3541259.1 FdtA/QdtA family cupin domain-containing protein [Rufibacter sediminis]
MLSSEPYLLSFLQLPDAGGTLVSTQDSAGLPFAARRIFWVFAADHPTERGGHAHRTTEEVLTVVQGNVRVETQTAQEKREFYLDAPAQGLYIPPFCWITVHPSPNAILCCMTSTVFEESDYIREYAEFKRLVLS